MIISSPDDFRKAARRKLPRFLFDYIDGGAFNELTLQNNISDMERVELRQRVLHGADEVDLSMSLFGEQLELPIALSPVGLTGMSARRGEVQAARAADKAGIPFTLSTVSICSLEEVAPEVSRPIWFQLYVLRDRGFMKHALERALAVGVKTLAFTVDLPTPGIRYKDKHSGMSGPYTGIRRFAQILTHPSWAFDVGLLGQPHTLGNVSTYLGKATNLADYKGWLARNFDPTIRWSDLEWIREFWPGNLLIKGILDPADVEDAIRLGADGLVVSNHGGRQLDGATSTIRALPDIVEAVNGRAKVIMDSGIRNGLDVIRALCLGADLAMIGRSYAYALAAKGEGGVTTLLDLYAAEMRSVMTLIGAQSVADLNESFIRQT